MLLRDCDRVSLSIEFGQTDHREYLIKLLAAELEAITARGWSYRCFIFGSFVRDPLKPSPSDIDTLIAIARSDEDCFWSPVSEKVYAWTIHFNSVEQLQSMTGEATAVRFNAQCKALREDVRLGSMDVILELRSDSPFRAPE